MRFGDLDEFSRGSQAREREVEIRGLPPKNDKPRGERVPMATWSSHLATEGPQNTCLQEGSGPGLSHGLCVRLSYSLWLTHSTLYFHPAAPSSEPS